jgi:hypothetical protein
MTSTLPNPVFIKLNVLLKPVLISSVIRAARLAENLRVIERFARICTPVASNLRSNEIVLFLLDAGENTKIFHNRLSFRAIDNGNVCIILFVLLSISYA